jgi:TIGR00292: thiazole biosynthesis enzyme
MNYDVIIIGAGPGGIFAAYELMKEKPDYKVAVFEEGYSLEKENVRSTAKRLKTVSTVRDARSCAVSAAQVHSLMENIISPMTLAEHCMNISARAKLLS